MRYIFSALILIHGLIHFMGFAKAFGYGNITQIAKSIPKPLGFLWMLTALLFILSTILILLKKDSWPAVSIVAVIISQFLIITVWQYAKFGTIANIVIIVVCLMAYGGARLNNGFRQDVADGLNNDVSLSPLTLADVEHLPEPVKKYIIYSGSIGKPKVHHFFIEFHGQIRKNAQSAWMPFVSEQYNFMHIPARLFFMKATMNHLTVAGYHRYMNGVAFMDIRLFSLFRVQYQSGREMGIAETVTFFNDMCCMAPATLIDERITWGKEKDNSIEAIFTVNDISITAILFLMTKASW